MYIIQNIFIFALTNFPITLLLFSAIFSIFSLLKTRKDKFKYMPYKIMLSYFLLFNIGVFYFYNFVMHVFFGEFTARFIGWEQSPFQWEVGFASLGFALLGFIGYRHNLSFRSAGIISSAVFLWGAAIGHLYQIIVNKNFAPGNTGAVFWADIFIPLIGFGLLYLQYKEEKNT